MKFVRYLLTSLLIFLFISCEKTLNFDLKSENNEIVVEGYIEKDELPYVSLSNSLGFFDKIDLNSLSFVKDAIVHVEDLSNGKKIKLRQYDIDTTIDKNEFSFTIYGPDITDPESFNFRGIEEHFYRLTIQSGNKISTSVTQVPKAVVIDSFWLEPVPGKEDKYKLIKGLYRDPDTFGNALKYQTRNVKRIKTGEAEIFYDPFISAYDDAVINGTIFPISFELGFNRNHTYPDGELFEQQYIKKGDTVTIRCSTIDKFVYRFFETLEASRNSVGNPFATPLKIQGNVENALGVWAGLGTSLYTIIDSLK